MNRNNRSGFDRIRHTILFELGLIATLVPLSLLFIDTNASKAGTVAIGLSLLAMGWNLIFNLLFDRYLLSTQGHLVKTKLHRLSHALLFELGLVIVTVPAIAWTLNLSLPAAFAADIGFIVYALVYAWGFNLIYDKFFLLNGSGSLTKKSLTK
ncbi:PACE efflux transporter [Vibrio amylolyticus]|uniref:PACE efflux transporter n=1 Tax=Vibrio amylolyticus TaxID=2847292 RepID=UPI003550BBBC